MAGARSRRAWGRSVDEPSESAEPESEPPSDPVEVARAICLRLLTMRPRTRAELADALARRGVPDDAAETVLGRLTEVGLVDDAAFAAAWVSSRHLGRGLARRALGHELRHRGVADETIAAAVEAVSADDELAAARELVARRLPRTAGLARDARTRRLGGLLARKGYPPGVCAQVVREALAAEGRPSDGSGGGP